MARVHVRPRVQDARPWPGLIVIGGRGEDAASLTGTKTGAFFFFVLPPPARYPPAAVSFRSVSVSAVPNQSRDVLVSNARTHARTHFITCTRRRRHGRTPSTYTTFARDGGQRPALFNLRARPASSPSPSAPSITYGALSRARQKPGRQGQDRI